MQLHTADCAASPRRSYAMRQSAVAGRMPELNRTNLEFWCEFLQLPPECTAQSDGAVPMPTQHAGAQVEAVDADSRGAGADCVVDNGDDAREVFMALKEAAATLSPIVRNRLHGIPQYILEYADLIVSNAVERPFLKPILVAGPVAGEKAALLQTLADEFPDVFAFPAIITDEAAGPLEDPGDGRCAAAGLP